MAKHYEVIVGNIGTIYNGRSEREALRRYRAYVRLSAEKTGRASGESVVMMTNGVLTREHLGSIAIEDQDDEDDDSTFGI